MPPMSRLPVTPIDPGQINVFFILFKSTVNLLKVPKDEVLLKIRMPNSPLRLDTTSTSTNRQLLTKPKSIRNQISSFKYQLQVMYLCLPTLCLPKTGKEPLFANFFLKKKFSGKKRLFANFFF